MQPDRSACSHEGYHQFKGDGTGEAGHVEYGSFEVFWCDTLYVADAPGWYWWACFPGYQPDGEPLGPFRTSYLAYVDARRDA